MSPTSKFLSDAEFSPCYLFFLPLHGCGLGVLHPCWPYSTRLQYLLDIKVLGQFPYQGMRVRVWSSLRLRRNLQSHPVRACVRAGLAFGTPVSCRASISGAAGLAGRDPKEIFFFLGLFQPSHHSTPVIVWPACERV